MSTTTQGGSKKTSPPKLRAACNQCNSAKVKCTGQKDGCNRCQSLKVDCVYVESRVGRVPGVRAKKSRQQPLDTMPDENPRRSKSLTPPLQEEPVFIPTPTNTSTYYSQEETSEWELQPNLHHELMEFGCSGDVFSESNIVLPGTPSSDPEAQTQNLDFGDNIIFSPTDYEDGNSVTPPIYEPTDTSSSTTNKTSTLPNKTDSHCILFCTQTIDRLERYIFDELTTLDIVLEIVKKALNNLEGLLDIHGITSSFSCKALFSVIMHQIVSLLEGGCEQFHKEKHPQTQVASNSWNTSFNRPLPIFPIFGLGAFESNMDEQRSWRSQIILKEVNRSLDVLGKMKMLMGNNSDSGFWSYSEELEKRIKILCDQLKSEKS